MNKKLLAIAVGAALSAAPMFASAAVTLYGQVQAEVSDEGIGGNTTSTAMTGTGSGKLVQGGGGRFQDGTSVEDNKRGRLGVKASEKLGNGLTAIAKVEWQISTVKADIDDGDRESFVGLKGGFGTITAGSLKNPYKYMGGVKYDPFVTTNIEARRYGGMTTGAFGQNSFMTDAVSYVTPKMGGIKLWATFSPDSVDGTDGDYGLGAMFKQKNFEVFVATTKRKANPGRTEYEAIKVGGMYKIGMHKLKAQYEMIDDSSIGTNGTDGALLFVGYEGKFGNNILVAQFADGEYDTAAGYASAQENQYYALGIIHKLSKKSRLFAGYGDMEVDNANGVAGATRERDAFTVGMRMDF
jgi:predicted porin